MSKRSIKLPQPAAKTIETVLNEFLDDQQKRLKPGALRKYVDVIGLFEDCLNGYAYEGLNKQENTLFERLYNADGDSQREFCQIFGPEKIPENVSEFLNYFMIRKVMCGKELKQAAGTVMKKLAKWLREKSYISSDEADDVAENGAVAARELPATEELAQALNEYADQTASRCEEAIEDYFVIEAVEQGKLRLFDLSGEEDMVIPIPPALGKLCRTGWKISGAIGKTSRGWRLLEVWNVYP